MSEKQASRGSGGECSFDGAGRIELRRSAEQVGEIPRGLAAMIRSAKSETMDIAGCGCGNYKCGAKTEIVESGRECG